MLLEKFAHCDVIVSFFFFFKEEMMHHTAHKMGSSFSAQAADNADTEEVTELVQIHL